jgi:hypothetical protein
VARHRVDGRDKPGHDEKTEANALPTANAISAKCRAVVLVIGSLRGLRSCPEREGPKQDFDAPEVDSDIWPRSDGPLLRYAIGLAGPTHGFEDRR